MQYKTELPFSFDGIKGNSKVVYTPFSVKVYQNGIESKRKGIFIPKYKMATIDGEIDYVKLSRNFDLSFSIEYKGEKKHLEEKLSIFEYIIGLFPLLLVILGGVIGALIGIFGATLNFNFMRQEKRLALQILVSIVITFICYLIYFILASLLGGLIYGVTQ